MAYFGELFDKVCHWLWFEQQQAVLSSAAVSVCVWLAYRTLKPSPLSATNRLVAITGCDSGVGFSSAVHCYSQGFHVVAMVLKLDSPGARELFKLAQGSERMVLVQVDVTKPEEVTAAVKKVNSLLELNSSLEFHTLMNNAGVMVFGETEWQTEHLISLQLNVNLTGAIRVAKHFAPLLRLYKGRLINVSSECAKLPLPGLAVYAASKAGLQAWSDALRVELDKYGVKVISFFPGSFFQQTNILSRQSQYAHEMHEAMTTEAANFYRDYFERYHQYLSGLAVEKPVSSLKCPSLYFMLNSALLDYKPLTHYQDTPLRYSLYHTLAHISPVSVRDRIVTWFTAMPVYKPAPST